MSNLTDLSLVLKGFQMETVEMNVVGMDCASCVAKVDKGLRALPGVLDVNVSLNSTIAIVQIDPEIIGADILHETVVDLGYKVSN
ncbi:hypothetical protein AGR2A_pa40040 [Agrobacterium genomosp. 2 str. CFBP 5494]|uniref:HMA domain-containing protein n=2 Tax=Rhizobiaceae TaxID=82115 RepID=A0A9W5B6W0_9HYPH|nr:copper-translocating P-type ATPase [Rhizobium sp. P007]CUX02009.1 hypothetical protein AGR2A_pa40040 [Agrobacterium genomosp. 2 str. CFBP 5494]